MPSRPRRSTPPSHSARALSPVRSAVNKTKHERNNNPSTRIHSLRRLLSRGLLPGKERQEKERELAALLLEQGKAQVAQASRKNLQRYHYVRFVERKKATKTLQKLRKLRESGSDKDEEFKAQFDKQIHNAEVDLNYTQYAPLGDKYISIFVQDGKDKETAKNRPAMNKKAYAILDEAQREELRSLSDDSANVARTAAGTKPPMWYEVEKCMAEGIEKLEALRDGKLRSGNQMPTQLVSVGGREEAGLRSANGKEIEESRPSWLDDDGMIDPKDLDSEEDEDMSDGGFFER